MDVAIQAMQTNASNSFGRKCSSPSKLLLMSIALVALVFLLLSACTAGGDDSTPTPSGNESMSSADPEAEPIPTSIIIDASGSMKNEDAPGQRFAAAQKAVGELVEAIPDTQETSLLAYGTETGSADDEKTKGCQDVTTLIEAGPVDKDLYATTVESLKPSGYTPISLALQKAGEQLPTSGERSIILLSDGIDTCADEGQKLNPCEVAKDLDADGKLAVHTVGFRVDGQASEQLSCLSEATGGTSWDAVNDRQLATRLSLAVNPQLANSTLTPDGYRGLRLGMSVAEVRKVDAAIDDVTDSGRVEVDYIDCVLVFVDGKLAEIMAEKTPTLDGIALGDDISDAEALYADPDLPTTVAKDGSVSYVADSTAGTGFKFYFKGAGQHRSGQKFSGAITKIVFCKCAPAGSQGFDSPQETIDVSAFDSADFTSPSGRIACGIHTTDGELEALCELPEGMDLSQLPDDESWCGTTDYGLAGVRLTTSVGWMCAGGMMATPDLSSSATDWFDATGFPPGPEGEYGFGPAPSAALPYGAALKNGPVICASAESGVSCRNNDTGAGFTIARSGATFTGPRTNGAAGTP